MAALRALAANQPYMPSSLFGGTLHHTLQTLRGLQLGYQVLIAGVKEIGGTTPISMSITPTLSTLSSTSVSPAPHGSGRGQRKAGETSGGVQNLLRWSRRCSRDKDYTVHI